MSREKLPVKVERTLSRFRKHLLSRYEDAQAYLFGSYADGTWLEDSDFDILVVSDKFKDQTFVERAAAVRRLAPSDEPFEILAYTTSEFREALRRSVPVQDAQRYWRRIV